MASNSVEATSDSNNCLSDTPSQCNNVYSNMALQFLTSNMSSKLQFSSSSSSSINKPLSLIKYYSSEFWDENSDPMTKEFFGMQTPWTFMTIGLSLVIFCKLIGPYLMKNRKPRDLRPIMIILNGFAFGTYTGGVVVALGGTGFEGCFDCQAYQPNTNDITKITLKYIGYCLIWTKIYDFLKPVLAVFSKKHHQVTWLQMLHLQAAVMFCWAGMKIHPGGIFIPVAVMDTIYQSLAYGYLVMKASSKEMKPSNEAKIWLLWTREITTLIGFLHQCYFVMRENCYTHELRWFAVLYTFFVMVCYPIDFFARENSIYDANQNKKVL